MQITVKLCASYRVGRFKEAERDYPAGCPVGDLLQTLGFTGKPPGVIPLNGMPAVQYTELHDGDTVALFPLVSGG
ncbi:MAG: MoaD/ThiS family protein [Desulfuromonadaceae bacterium]|nr:MoaD/ThiS family protein [Desulfuromonadaceae bacterium]